LRRATAGCRCSYRLASSDLLLRDLLRAVGLQDARDCILSEGGTRIALVGLIEDLLDLLGGDELRLGFVAAGHSTVLVGHLVARGDREGSVVARAREEVRGDLGIRVEAVRLRVGGLDVGDGQVRTIGPELLEDRETDVVVVPAVAARAYPVVVKRRVGGPACGALP